MKFGKYIKEKLGIIAGYAGFVIFTYLLMMAFHSQLQMRIMFVIVAVIFVVSVIAFDYLRKYKFYNSLVGHLDELDQKYLILDTLDEPDFYEGKLVYSAMYDINKSMTENVRKYRDSVEDFKDFIEIWVHEIKLPIASLTLMLHNNMDKCDKEFADRMNTQIRRINNYIEQILYYVRSENAEKDYIINDARLSKIISNVALKNKDDLLENDITFEVSNADRIVLTDAKWMEFMLNQIVNNSIKYKDKTKTESYIKMSAAEDKKCVVLEILDNGIGINASDLPRVFDKSFTGENGREFSKATGMGLYIVKKLCDKLGSKVSIESVKGEYTRVKITFYKNDFYKEITDSNESGSM